MTNPDASQSAFGRVATQAATGELRLEPGVAETCIRACDEFLDKLDDLRTQSRQMSTLSAYGDLASAQALGLKFDKKALGEGGFREVIDRHIDTVQQMRDLFERASRNYHHADAAAADRLAAN
jgi:hypothetical protein